jgi:hypothetical protein
VTRPSRTLSHLDEQGRACMVDVSGKAIEETATTILEKYRGRFERDANGGSGRSTAAVAARPPGAPTPVAPSPAPAPAAPAPGKPRRPAASKAPAPRRRRS